jgi:hypothetical protein
MKALEPVLGYVKNAAIAKYMGEYQGDLSTVEGAMGLYRRYGQVSGLFGDAPDPREAMSMAAQAENTRRGRRADARAEEQHGWEREERQGRKGLEDAKRQLAIGETAYKLFASGNMTAGRDALNELYPEIFFGDPVQTTRTEGPYTSIDFVLPVQDGKGNQLLDEAGKPRSVRLSDAGYMLGQLEAKAKADKERILSYDEPGEYGESIKRQGELVTLPDGTKAIRPLQVLGQEAEAPTEKPPAEAPKEEGSWLSRLFGGGEKEPEAPAKPKTVTIQGKEYPVGKVVEVNGKRYTITERGLVPNA